MNWLVWTTLSMVLAYAIFYLSYWLGVDAERRRWVKNAYPGMAENHNPIIVNGAPYYVLTGADYQDPCENCAIHNVTLQDVVDGLAKITPVRFPPHPN